jgi:hypothetical protein
MNGMLYAGSQELFQTESILAVVATTRELSQRFYMFFLYLSIEAHRVINTFEWVRKTTRRRSIRVMGSLQSPIVLVTGGMY